MKAITREQVEYVAHLARLALTPEEAERFTGQLDRILASFEKLGELDTEGVEPTRHAIPIVNAFRDDRKRPSCEADKALTNAPDKHESYFKVPRIIE